VTVYGLLVCKEFFAPFDSSELEIGLGMSIDDQICSDALHLPQGSTNGKPFIDQFRRDQNKVDAND